MIRPYQTVFVDPMELDPCSLKVLSRSLRDSPPSNFPIRRGNTTLELNIQSQRASKTSPCLPLLLQCYQFGISSRGLCGRRPMDATLGTDYVRQPIATLRSDRVAFTHTRQQPNSHPLPSDYNGRKATSWTEAFFLGDIRTKRYSHSCYVG